MPSNTSPRKGRTYRADELVPRVLRSFGVPSQNVTRQVADAWAQAADPSWAGKVTPERLVGGVLLLLVSSSALRQELQQFHRERLLRVLQAALPGVPIVRLHFVEGSGAAPEPSTPEQTEDQ